MKIYFAGPLFTPYVRQYINEKAAALRAAGIEVFVPHEHLFGSVDLSLLDGLFEQGVLRREELAGRPAEAALADMVRSGRLRRDQVGLPPITADLVFDVDCGGVAGANAVLAILDGTQVDDGTACELGIFFGLLQSDPSKKGIVGLMTDSRGHRRKETGYGLNYFVLGLVQEIGVVVDNFEDALQQLLQWDAELKAGR